MDAWQTILLALGGNAALLLVLGWLARSLGSQVLAKDLESLKSVLSAATSEASERLKHPLQLASHEHQMRFSKLHEKRGEVIAEYAPEHVIKEKYQGWAKSSEYFDTEVPRARRALERELRAMLSGEVANVA